MSASSNSPSQAILDRAEHVLIHNYARMPVVMARGEGCHLWDADGREYLDLFAGFGGCILGHCHPDLVRAATGQANKLWHVGNTYHTEPQIEFAERLNKSARKWKIITLSKSFHGRTLAMIAATGNPAIRAGFAPDVPGFVNVEMGD